MLQQRFINLSSYIKLIEDDNLVSKSIEGILKSFQVDLLNTITRFTDDHQGRVTFSENKEEEDVLDNLLRGCIMQINLRSQLRNMG